VTLYAYRSMPGSTPSVTPHGVRDGEPASLAGLAQRRSGSVLDYARHACGERAAMDAAAESFARFRGAVVAADDLRSLAPDALLLSCTRNAAAALVPVAGGGGPACYATPHLIVGRFEATNSVADAARLARHVQTCAACTELATAFDHAERAFRAPHPPAPGGVVVARVIAALESAAPITWRAYADGATAVAEPTAGEILDDVFGPEDLDDDTTEFAAAGTTVAETGATDTVPGPIDIGRGVLVPAVIVTASVGLAMGIAGVFGGPEPTPARGAVGLPAPTPPARPPLADDRTQDRAARAARAALRRIEAREDVTTRQAALERAAEQQSTAAPGGRTGDATNPPLTRSQPAPVTPTSPQSGSDGGDGSSIERVTPEQGGETSPDAPVFEPGSGTP